MGWEGRRVAEVFPRFAHELESALRGAGESALATTVNGLRVFERCDCGEADCQSFAAGPQPAGGYGPGHRNVSLNPVEPYLLVLDVIDGDVVFVEVLGRSALD